MFFSITPLILTTLLILATLFILTTLFIRTRPPGRKAIVRNQPVGLGPKPLLLGLALPCLVSPAALAQTGLTLPPFTPIVTANPLVADAGTARTLTVSASWPDSCPPGNPTLSVSTAGGQDTLNIVFTLPQTLVACAQTLTPYTASFSHTPARAGVQRVAVLLADGRYLGGGELVTQTAGQARSAQDLTGAWFDPATSGSGLAIYHSHSNTDALAGAWYTFDNVGQPYWYLIQNGRWVSGTQYSGQLMAAQATAGACSNPLPACVKPQQDTRIVANISLQSLAFDRIRVTVTPHGEITPSVILADFEATRLRF